MGKMSGWAGHHDADCKQPLHAQRTAGDENSQSSFGARGKPRLLEGSGGAKAACQSAHDNHCGGPVEPSVSQPAVVGGLGWRLSCQILDEVSSAENLLQRAESV